MSNASGASSGTSNARIRGKVVGVPKVCWCGAQIVEKMSKSEANPYRRYYRCSFAAAHKLSDDNHIFKWIDEAMMNEIETLVDKISRLEQDVCVITRESLEKMRMEIEQEVLEKLEGMLMEGKSNMRKMMVVVILVFIIMFGIMKVIDFKFLHKPQPI